MLAPTVREANVLRREARSWAAFEKQFPHIALRIDAQPPMLELVRQDDCPIDFEYQGQRFYKGDGRAQAALQVKDYLKDPNRLLVNTPTTIGLGNPVSRHMLNRVGTEMQAMGLSQLPRAPTHDSTFLVVLGLGLGHHLESLIAEIRPKYLVIVEPMAEFLRGASAVLDWQSVLDSIAAAGGEVHVICDSQPRTIVDKISALVTAVGVPYLDGTYVYLHYPSWTLRETRILLGEVADRLYLSKGFFEDELVMLTNCHANLARHRFRLIAGERREARREPAFVIGSGPSIDESLDYVKKWREHVVLFSCGTSLRILLQNGLIPDFHCELENGTEVFDSLTLVASQFSLKGITLIASTSVDPRIAPLFDDVMFYVRDTISSTQLLHPRDKAIYLTGPTVTNTATAVGAMLGFVEFYLFGVDCGVKDGRQHHSKDTLYYSDDNWRAIADQIFNFPLSVPGNFGGIVATNYFLDLTRTILSGVRQSMGVNLYNCSDGARIDGARPKLPAAVRLIGGPIAREKVVAEITAATPSHEPGAYLAAIDLPGIVAACEEYYAAADAMIDAAQNDDADFAAFLARLHAFFEDKRRTHGAVAAIGSGSALAIPKIGAFAIHRLDGAAARRGMFMAFLEEYRKIFAEMKRDTLALFDRLADGSGTR